MESLRSKTTTVQLSSTRHPRLTEALKYNINFSHLLIWIVGALFERVSYSFLSNSDLLPGKQGKEFLRLAFLCGYDQMCFTSSIMRL